MKKKPNIHDFEAFIESTPDGPSAGEIWEDAKKRARAFEPFKDATPPEIRPIRFDGEDFSFGEHQN